LRLSLEIDEEGELRPIRVDATLITLGPLAEGLQVEAFESPIRPCLRAVMGHEQLIVDQVNISFDTTETVIEGIVQRARVFVVVVRVSVGKGVYN
jgi:hypothetical protein